MQKKTRSWWIDWILVCAVLLLAESARGVVIGTLSKYLFSLGGDEFFLGVVIAAFSVGRLIASFAFGALADYWTTRSVLLLSTVGCMGGNFLFAFSSTVSSKYLLLFSRVLTGFGTGMLSVARTHVSVTTPSDERTLWMSWLGIVQFVGFAITPVLGNVSPDFSLWIVPVNGFTFATLVLLILEVLLFICLCLFMSKQSTHENTQANTEIEKQNIDAAQQQPIDVHGGDLESDTAYQQMKDGESVDAVRQRSILEERVEDDEKQVYLDDEVAQTSSSLLSSHSSLTGTQSSTKSDWAPRDLMLTTSHDVSSFHSTPLQAASMDRRGSQSLENLQQRDIVVYMEQKTPSGVDTIYTPHHFKFTNDPNDTENTSGTLIATTSSASNLPILTPALLPSPEDEPYQHYPPPPTTPFRRFCHRHPYFDKCVVFLQQSYVPLIFVLLNLSGRGVLSVAEAYGTAMYTAITADPDNPDNIDTSAASNFFLVMGCLGLVVFLCMNRLVKYVEETNLLMFAFISMGIGFGVIVDFDEYDIDIYDFTAGMTLVWVIGTPISQTLSVSLLSKHFSQQQKQGIAPTKGVGFWMGLVTASGSVGRIIFPLVAGALYGSFGVSSALLFTSLVSFLTVPLIFFALEAYRPYVPFIKERMSCLFKEGQDNLGHPHTMARTISNDGTADLVGYGSQDVDDPNTPQAELAPLSANSERRAAAARASLPDLTSPPLVYLVSSHTQPSQTPLPLPTPATPLMMSGGSGFPFERHGSLKKVNNYTTPTSGRTPSSNSTGPTPFGRRSSLSRIGEHYMGEGDEN